MENPLTAEALAKQFEDDLNKDHKIIKIWACYSGLGMRKNMGLAYRFWKAMHEQEFNDLSVYRYVECIIDPMTPTSNKKAAIALEGFVSLSKTPDKIKIIGRASRWRIGIDAKGEIIASKYEGESLL
jgi:hypothetical protein